MQADGRLKPALRKTAILALCQVVEKISVTPHSSSANASSSGEYSRRSAAAVVFHCMPELLDIPFTTTNFRSPSSASGAHSEQADHVPIP